MACVNHTVITDIIIPRLPFCNYRKSFLHKIKINFSLISKVYTYAYSEKIVRNEIFNSQKDLFGNE